jgi:hypothetical protein
MPALQNQFWHVKSRIQDNLLAQFNPDRLRLVQVDSGAIRRFLTEMVRTEAPSLNPLVVDCFVLELIKDFFTDNPLIKVTILNCPALKNRSDY